MDKIIILEETIYELCSKYPEIKDILKGLGFEDITNPLMMNTAGRVMTLLKGIETKKVDMNAVKEELRKYGFKIIE